MNVAERLVHEGYAFEFFQAVRLLERLQPTRRRVGRRGPPRDEIVRFRAHLSLAFPPSTIYEVVRPGENIAPTMTVNFFGLTGPSGVLPRCYTERLLIQDRDTRGPERYALRAWLDLFNHRLLSLFYRAWEKYRFHLFYERGAAAREEPDTFSLALFSFIGLGMKPLRHRLHVRAVPSPTRSNVNPTPRELARIDDLALLHYAGMLAQRRRPAITLEALLVDYFDLPVEVQQFRGRWLPLEPANQTSLGTANGDLGLNVVAGERVWDVQSKIRLRLGPLRRDQFEALLPDRSPIPYRKGFFLLSQLVRLFLGPEFDFDVQLVLRKEDVPAFRLAPGGLGARLGWNTWSITRPVSADAEEAVFEGDETRNIVTTSRAI
jgi:type VI secretion system protein ImpH